MMTIKIKSIESTFYSCTIYNVERDKLNHKVAVRIPKCYHWKEG